MPHALPAVAAAAVLLLWLVPVADALRHRSSVLRLADVRPVDGRGGVYPAVSVVVAARNEARAVETGVRSLLALAYPRFEVVAVDDRSTDGTGAILERLAQEAGGGGRLRVLRVTSLPAGWLGKNHALALGATATTGEWLLFTDADVVFQPGALARAMEVALGRRLDHLTAAPDLVGRGFWLTSFLGCFTLGFGLVVRPWRAASPRSPAYVGIGAFNLLRRGVYDAVGGHERLRQRPDDDMMLGRAVKHGGFRQELVLGGGLLRVEWYRTVGEAVRGLEKNMFAAAGYRLGRTLLGASLVLGLGLLPFIGAAAASGWPRWAFAAAACVALASCMLAGREVPGFRAWHAAALPALSVLWSYILLRSALLALARGGIVWRGTFYPLAELRARRKPVQRRPEIFHPAHPSAGRDLTGGDE